MDPQEWVGQYFQLWEAMRSETAARLGIDNSPDPEQLDAIRRHAQELMDPVRERFGPLRISSWLRVPALNAAIPDSSSTSAHRWGGAADFHPIHPGVRLRSIVEWIAATDLPFDQLIYEYGRWVHLGSARLRAEPRRQVLMKFRGSGYLPFDPADPRVCA